MSSRLGRGRLKYRIGIDLGTNSLGWAAIQLNGEERLPGPLLDLGVRIFSDARNPKNKSSNAAQRRVPRGMRRNRDRKLSRARAMIHELVQAGLLPERLDERKRLERLDPWILRAAALDRKLDAYEVGRALLHLQKRRGFKSNRKTDGDSDGAMLEAIEVAREKMANADARTLGQLFGRLRIAQLEANRGAKYGERSPLPQARVKARTVGSKMSYDYYPERSMILDEFEAIWATQARYHAAQMNSAAHASIRRVIEFQRPLKPQRAGKCTFLPDQERAARATPSAQYARVLQEVNNLEVGAVGEQPRRLTRDEQRRLIDFLMTPTSQTARRTFKSLRKKLGLPESQRFNLESLKRDFLVGDETAARLMQDNAWGSDWLTLSRRTQNEIVMRLLETEEEGALVDWLVENHALSHERAEAIARIRLPDGYGKLSDAALQRLMPHLEEGARYDEAASREFGDHRAVGDGEIHDGGLPYYGKLLCRHTAFERQDPQNDEERYGRVANPTVHVALNELRKVINDLIKRWGPPEQVVLELARDLPLSDRGLRDLETRQKKDQDLNDARRTELAKLGVADSYDNRLKLRLYEEALEAFGGVAVCVFTGASISKTSLFTADVEVEHVLPRARTLDDSFSNKVLSMRSANRIKRNKTPFEAFGHSPEGFDWEAIGDRAARLPGAKSWRFSPDAIERWEGRGGDFLARHLNDTRYIARLGKTFVEGLFGGQGVKGQHRSVWVIPGQLTADLRHYAGFNTLSGITGLNRKDRTDHRHHAVDALVVALTDQAMIKRAAELSKRDARVERHEIMQAMAEPLKRYRASAEDRLHKLTVSHKPDHGFQGAMHNDTAYGVTERRDENGQMILVTRKAVSDLKPGDLENIVDPLVRARFEKAGEGLRDKAFSDALSRAGEEMRPSVRRVRLTTPMRESSYVTIVHGSDGQHTKAYKGDGNYCYDIYLKENGAWGGEVVTTFQAYQRALRNADWWKDLTRPDGSQLIMRIRKGDMLEIEGEDGERESVVVYKFSAGKVNMSAHHEANASARIRAGELSGYQMSPTSLQRCGALKLSVTPSGRVRRHRA